MNKKPTARARKSRIKLRKPDLDLRREPTQMRGLETFERILDMTATLLDEVGADAITTNLIAQSAAINVATLYQYFPNKRAILVQLFQRQAEQRRKVIEDSYAASMRRGGQWRGAIDAAVEAVYAMRRDLPGQLPLSQAVRSDPALVEYDREESKRISQWLASEIERVAAVSAADAALVARCATEAVRALLDLGQLNPTMRQDDILAQAKAMAARYLEPYFQTAKRPAARRARVSR